MTLAIVIIITTIIIVIFVFKKIGCWLFEPEDYKKYSRTIEVSFPHPVNASKEKIAAFLRHECRIYVLDHYDKIASEIKETPPDVLLMIWEQRKYVMDTYHSKKEV